MGQFNWSYRNFNDGTVIPDSGGGTTPFLSDPISPDTTGLTQTAPKWLGGNLEFLFWDTGRHATNKRKVKWKFSDPDSWDQWNAVAWYGTPPVSGTGVPTHEIDTSAFWIGNGPLVGTTPIDPSGSVLVNGGGAGQTAYPYNGSNQDIDTEWGNTTVRALAQVTTAASGRIDFVDWVQLIWGGDDTGEFDEDDSGPPDLAGGTAVGSTSIDFSVGMGGSAILVAAYVSEPAQTITKPNVNVITKPGPIIRGDIGPVDALRVSAIQKAMAKLRGMSVPSQDAFSIGDHAAHLAPPALREATVAVESALRRGTAALSALQAAQAKPGG